ncbi:MAG: zonular occludens toxin domain-containing protein [Flavobacteriaceae bacterium]
MSYVKFVQGKLGGGKGKYSVLQAQEYLRAGRPVATNMDLILDKLVSPRNKMSVIRVPDKPRIEDLEALGYSYTGKYDKRKNGLLILDELGTWFNSRNWNDPSRKKIIDFMLHIRKFGWDVILQVQDISLVDKQLRDATGQLLVNCINLANVPIPFISFWTRLFFGKSLYLPEFHKQTTYLGDSTNGYKLEGFFYKGKDIESAYDTRQVFTLDEQEYNGSLVDMRSSYCLLSAWHLKGRYQNTILQRIKKIILNSFYRFASFIYFLLKGNPPSAAGGFTIKTNSTLVSVLMNEEKPLLINPDNLYLFPAIKQKGLSWVLFKQTD